MVLAVIFPHVYYQLFIKHGWQCSRWIFISYSEFLIFIVILHCLTLAHLSWMKRNHAGPKRSSLNSFRAHRHWIKQSSTGIRQAAAVHSDRSIAAPWHYPSWAEHLCQYNNILLGLELALSAHAQISPESTAGTNSQLVQQPTFIRSVRSISEYKLKSGLCMLSLPPISNNLEVILR